MPELGRPTNLSNRARPVLAITMGDPNGIGPEIVVKALADPQIGKWCIPIVVGLPTPLQEAVRMVGSNLEFAPVSDPSEVRLEEGRVPLLRVPVEDRAPEWGQPTDWSGRVAGSAVEMAVETVKTGIAQALVTAPLSKKALNMGGYHYQGHTEMLAALTGSEQVAMMHVTGSFRIILATTHLPLKDVPGAVTEEMVLGKIRLADYALKDIFRIKAPRLAVTALNPHSGEDGLLAYGEDDRITAAIEKARVFSINVQGPFPADTLFRWADDYDMIIFMYHDQGSIPFKWIARGRGVNWTLGLPFTRTSVDHGTGFDIAGKNLAAAYSLTEAIRMAAWSVSRVEPEYEVSEPTPAAPPTELTTAPYNRLAGIYDYVMRHVDYALWKRYLFKLFQRHRIPMDRILELAAGTGRLAELLAKAGTQLTAMDRSGAMLEMARPRLEKKNKSIPLVVGDLRDLPFKGSFPVVLCLYDSINYMMNHKEFLRCLKEVHRITEPDGFFVFDVTTEANSMRHFTRELSFEETDDFSYLRRSYYDPVKKIQHNDFTMFMRDDGIFSRFFEAHEQKIFFHQEIRSMVEASGFELLEALAGFTFSRADDRSTRIHYILQKRGKAVR